MASEDGGILTIQEPSDAPTLAMHKATSGLRSGVKWQNIPPVNGRVLTSADVECTVDRIKQRMIRFGWVQNAADQPRHVASRLTGAAADYDALPWCWSDQGDLKLQISGLANPADERVELASPGAPAADGPALPAASPDGCGDRERPGRSQAGPASARRGRRPAHGRGGRGPRPDDLARRARPSRRQLRRIGGNATSKPTEGSRVARVRVQHEAAEGRDATGPLRCQRAARGLSSSPAP